MVSPNSGNNMQKTLPQFKTHEPEMYPGRHTTWGKEQKIKKQRNVIMSSPQEMS